MRNLNFAILLGLQPLAFGQIASLSIGSDFGTPGGTVSLPITLSGGSQAAVLQWSFNYSSDITGVTVVAGSSTIAGGKTLSCSGNTCLVYGIDTNTLPDGVVAVATFQIAWNPSTTNLGVLLNGVVAANLSGNPMPASGGIGTIGLPTGAPPPPVVLSALTCNTTSLTTPGSTPCTVWLSAAPLGGGLVVPLSSNNFNVFVPPSVTVNAGQTAASFTATAAQVSTNQTAVVMASSGGGTSTVTLNLLAAASPNLVSLSCSPAIVSAPGTSSCTAGLTAAAPSGGVTVSLSSNNANISVPGSVFVSAGQSGASFNAMVASVGSDQSALLTASLNGVSQFFTLTGSTSARLSSLSCSPSTIGSNASSTCTVWLSKAAVAAITVNLSSNSFFLAVPPSVTVAASQSSATFAATSAIVILAQNVTVSGSFNGVTQSATIGLTYGGPAQLSSLSCSPSTIGSNASSTCTVSLDQAAVAATVVTLSSSSGSLTVPASVTIYASQSIAAFAATTATVSSAENVIVSGSYNGFVQSTSIGLTVTTEPGPLSCSPAIVSAPGTSSCTVSLAAPAPAGGATVSLSSNNANISVPGSVFVSAGQSSAFFNATVASVSSDQTALLTASLNGASQSFTLTASAPPQLSSLSCSPSTIGSNASSTCTVWLNKSAVAAITINLSSSSGSLTVPASVTVAASQSSATFAVTTATVVTAQNVTVSGSFNGVTQSATIGLTATTQPSVVSCFPAIVSAPGTSSCTVGLTAPAPAGGANVSLSSGNPNISVPGSVFVGAGLSSSSFNATVASISFDQTALLTASLNGASQSFTLTLTAGTPARLSSLSCSPSTMGSNASSTCTVWLSNAAVAAITVNLSTSSFFLAVPASVTVAASQSSATFVATTAIVIFFADNATVSGSYNGVTQSAIIALTPSVFGLTSVFRDSAGSIRLTRQDTTTIYNGGGSFASDPAVAQNAIGDSFVVARDTSGSVGLNVFTARSDTWGSWQMSGGIAQGMPAIAMGRDGTAYIATRDDFNSYWLTSYTVAGGFGSPTYLSGDFSTDPVVAASPDGSIYIVGKDNSNSLLSGQYVPGSGFEGWQYGAGIWKGKPSVTVGTDSVAYVAARDNEDSLWIARVQRNVWLGWSYGGGVMSADPQVVALGNGFVSAVLPDSENVVWYRSYTEGTENGWQRWTSTGRVLKAAAAASTGGELYVIGKDVNDDLWWYHSKGDQWARIGNRGLAAGKIAAPR